MQRDSFSNHAAKLLLFTAKLLQWNENFIKFFHFYGIRPIFHTTYYHRYFIYTQVVVKEFDLRNEVDVIHGVITIAFIICARVKSRELFFPKAQSGSR